VLSPKTPGGTIFWQKIRPRLIIGLSGQSVLGIQLTARTPISEAKVYETSLGTFLIIRARESRPCNLPKTTLNKLVRLKRERDAPIDPIPKKRTAE
jgi:hypothetical protein